MNKSTLFIDESGKSSLATESDSPFILTGVILDNEEIIKIEGFFDYIKRKYEIDINKPFHGFHMYENSNTKLSDSKLKELSKTMAEFISLIPIKIQIFSVNKKKFRKVLGITDLNQFKGNAARKDMREFPYRLMAAKLFKWFAEYLEQENRSGNIIADARLGGDVVLLKTLNDCKDPSTKIGEQNRLLIKERCSAICFAEKNFLSGGLEITDLISHITYFHVRKLVHSMKSTGVDYIWKQIKTRADTNKVIRIEDNDIREYFGILPNEVHKLLKTY